MYLHKHRQIYIVPTETNFRNRETEIWDKATTGINKLIQQMVLDKEYSWTFFIIIFSDLNILNICISLQLRISKWLKGHCSIVLSTIQDVKPQMYAVLSFDNSCGQFWAETGQFKNGLHFESQMYKMPEHIPHKTRS